MAYCGQIVPVAFGFAPPGWLLCDGSLKPVSQYNTLFTLIGTTYGGDGQQQFAVPDLRGRVAVGYGQSPSGSPYALGQAVGAEQVALGAAHTPQHSHTLYFVSNTANLTAPQKGAVIGAANQPALNVFGTRTPTVALNSASVTTTPGGAAHENRQPYLVINYIINWDGPFPPR